MRASCLGWFWLVASPLGGCATRSPVRTEHPLDQQVETEGTPALVVSAALDAHGDSILLHVTERTPFDTHALVQVRTGERYTWASAQQPALGWGIASASTAAAGLAVRWGETQQPVEIASYSSGATSDAPSTTYRDVEPNNRIGSTTLLVGAAALGTVALGQLLAPVLPAGDRTRTETRQFVDRRWVNTPAADAQITLWSGTNEVGAARTDAAGDAHVDPSSLPPANPWTWTLTARVDGAEASLDLRDSPAAGGVASQRVSALVAAGRVPAALEVLTPLGSTSATHGLVWTAFCEAATDRADQTDTVADTRLLLPPESGPAACDTTRAAISTRAAAKVRAATQTKDLPLARSWLSLVQADDAGPLQAHIDQTQARITAKQEAAFLRAQRQERASWKARTSRALTSCATTQRELSRRKSQIERLGRSGQIGAAQDQIDRLQSWMNKTGEPKLSAALEELRDIREEMERQDIAQELQVPWMHRVARDCGDR